MVKIILIVVIAIIVLKVMFEVIKKKQQMRFASYDFVNQHAQIEGEKFIRRIELQDRSSHIKKIEVEYWVHVERNSLGDYYFEKDLHMKDIGYFKQDFLAETVAILIINYVNENLPLHGINDVDYELSYRSKSDDGAGDLHIVYRAKNAAYKKLKSL